jgi:hypothetical protein
MRFAGIVIVVLGLFANGCATAQRGDPVGRGFFGSTEGIGRQVAFDHGCPEDRVRVIRGEFIALDLDVCGVVRRYKSVASGLAGSPFTWLDVTSAYPEAALPAPLPPTPGK